VTLPLAHETWFESSRPPADWGFAGETLTLALLAAAVVLTVAVRLLAPQVVVLVAGIPFNATLWFFGINELAGHLPVYGAMLVVLVYGSPRCCGPRSATCGPGAGCGNPAAARGALRRPRRARASSVDAMSFRAIVAGGGVAGVETVLALHDLAGDRVEVVLVSEEPAFRVRALATATPFSAGHVLERPLSELAELSGARLRIDRVERVVPAERRVELASGERLAYDALVLAAGAVPRAGVAHATTFGLDSEPDAVNGILATSSRATAAPWPSWCRPASPGRCPPTSSRS